METTIHGLYRVIGFRDHGKEKGNHYRVQGSGI